MILSILSSDGSTSLFLTLSALSEIDCSISFCSSLAGSTTFSYSASGTGNCSISDVCISATSWKTDINSGKLKKFAKRVFIRYPFPSGDNSIAVTVSPKMDAQLSNIPRFISCRRSYCRYLWIVYNSVILLLTGVPVANVIPLPPVISSIYRHLLYISIAFCDSLCATPATFLIFVYKNKFLKPCDSSTNNLSTPSSSKVTTSSFFFSFSFSSLTSKFFLLFTICLTV